MTHVDNALKVIRAEPWLTSAEIGEKIGISSAHAAMYLDMMTRDRPLRPATVRWEANEKCKGRPLRRWATLDCLAPLPVVVKTEHGLVLMIANMALAMAMEKSAK